MRRMKKIYQIISILLAVCLLTGIVGCRKKEQKADAKYTIYQINQSGTALVPKDYDGTGKSVDEEVKGMLSALQKCDDEVKAQAALPKKVKLERYTLEDEKLILYYNAAYGKMDTVREVLCRAALVRSLMYLSPTRFPNFNLNLSSDLVVYRLPDFTSTGLTRGFIAASGYGFTRRKSTSILSSAVGAHFE